MKLVKGGTKLKPFEDTLQVTNHFYEDWLIHSIECCIYKGDVMGEAYTANTNVKYSASKSANARAYTIAVDEGNRTSTVMQEGSACRGLRP